MDLNDIFQSIAVNMLLEFEHTQTQIKHMGERGSEREAVLKSFLSTYLPTRYGISSGEILDTEGRTSHQCDLIIYDHTNCPLLLAGKKVQIFPAESVFAVIEVKSVLSIKEIKDSAMKIRDLKNLTRENGPIPGIIFAYKSGWKKEPIKRTVIELQKHYRQFQGHQFVDLICILNHGVIALDTVYDGFSVVNDDFSQRCMLAYYELDMSVLLWFFTNLLDLLETYSYVKPIYHEYAKRPDKLIGYVQKLGVIED
jgi:hypothetical protein